MVKRLRMITVLTVMCAIFVCFGTVCSEAADPSPREIGMVDIYCAQTARDALSNDDLEYFIDLIRNRLQPQAVEMTLDKFPDFRVAADMGSISRELSLYIYYKKGDIDGKPGHDIKEPSMVQVIGGAESDSFGEAKFKYMLAIDLSYLVTRSDIHSMKWVLDREGESMELLKDRLAGEMLRAVMFDYNRTGMIGAANIEDALRKDDGSFPNEELAEKYEKLVYPKWFTEGIAASVENIFRSGNDQFQKLRSEENNDLFNNYIKEESGFDLEDNVMSISDGPDESDDSDESDDLEKPGRVSGYLAVLYLAELQAVQDGQSSIDDNGAFSAESLRNGLSKILTRMHNGETLDQVIYDLSPLDSEGRKIYLDTEGFEQRFIKGQLGYQGDDNYLRDENSIEFVNTLLDYLESGKTPEGELYGGSILTDLKESRSPLDAGKEQDSDILQIIESNQPIESTVPDSVALAGGGRSAAETPPGDPTDDILPVDTAVSEIKNGTVYLELTTEELAAAGYEVGDMVSVSIGGMEPIVVPFVSGGINVGYHRASLAGYLPDNRVILLIGEGDFAQQYGIAENQAGLAVKIEIAEKDAFLQEYKAWDIGTMSNDRNDFPGLSDKEFANFRMVRTTGIMEGVLYRTSSPVNPRLNRNKIADKANKSAGVTTILNLSGSLKQARSYEGYSKSYYATVNHIELSMKTDYGSKAFNEKLVKGLRFMIAHPGVFEVNCIYGKDRTGFVIAVLEALAGASYDELVQDYAATYSHYYPNYNNYEPIEERDRVIGEGNLIKQMEYAYGVNDLKTVDIKKATEDYLRGAGMTDKEIRQLRHRLTHKYITPKVTLSSKTYTYSGKVRKPAVTVKYRNKVLDDSNYTVTYGTGRKNVGSYKVKVTMKGDYAGSKTVSFKILPKGTKIVKVKRSSGKAVIRWKKQKSRMSRSRITGYKIQLATNRKFTKNRKTVTVKGYGKTSVKVSGLKNKKYYVRIRTYKKTGGKTYYSAWNA